MLKSGYDRFRDTTANLPGGGYAWRAADQMERGLLQALKNRLDGLDRDGGGDAETEWVIGYDDPGHLLQDLMDRSLSQQPDLAEHELYSRMLEQLVPDEARVIASLSDGNDAPLCHLDAVNLLGTSGNRMLSNASRIGVECGVMLAEYMPFYLAHLRELGFLALGPEDKRFNAQYELIENDARMRAESRRIEKELQLRPRISRHTVRLSPLGMRLWAFCHEQMAGTQK